MAKSLTNINESLNRIDVSSLVKYSEKIKGIGGLSKMQASAYMQDFICAIDITGLMLTNALRLDIDAKSVLSSAESIAYLDKAAGYLKDKSIKETDNSKKMYVNIDPDVLAARDVKAKTEALVALLKNKLQVFRCAHDDAKKIGYADQHITDFEGF